MYLEKYSFNRDESHMAFREEKLVYFSDNHVSIELGNQTLINDVIFICQQWKSHKGEEVGGLVLFAIFLYRKGSKIEIKLRNTLVLEYIGLFYFLK